MKKLQISLMIICTILMANALSATAATPELSLGSTSIAQDSTATIKLNFSGSGENYAGINDRILLPQGLSVTVEKGELLPGTFIIDSFTFSGSDGNGIALMAYSDSETFNGAGTLLSLNLIATSDAKTGTYDISFAADDSDLINSEHAISNEDGSISVSHSTRNGTLTVEPADSDSDGMPNYWEKTTALIPTTPMTRMKIQMVMA